MENPTLAQILALIGIKNFNDLVTTTYSGDKHWVSDCLSEDAGNNYFSILSQAGITDENFPYEELYAYLERLTIHLSENLIIPLS